jgi:hypothetical protein
MKKAKSIQTSLSCKATASLSAEVSEDLEKEDKCLGSLLNDKEENKNVRKCGRCENTNKGCRNSI